MSLHAEYYYQKTYFHIERQQIFRKNWVLIAHAQEFGANVSQVAKDIFGIPLLVVQTSTATQSFRVFLNICKHRGGALLHPEHPTQSRHIRCSYHGWKYNEEGKLEAVPAYGAPCPDLHLTRFPVWVKEGCIFAFLDPDHPPPSTKALEHATAWNHIQERLPRCQLLSIQRHRLQCNWKIYAENYLEGYHIPIVHPQLTKEIKMRTYRVSVENNEIIHHVQTIEGAQSDGYWSFLWPNIACNIYANGMNIERIIPLSASETMIEYWYFFTDSIEAQSTISLSSTVTKEDIDICERLHFNISSGLYTPGPLSPRHENGVERFQQWIKEALGEQPESR